MINIFINQKLNGNFEINSNHEMIIRPYITNDCEKIIQLFKLNTPKYFAVTEEEDLIYYLDEHAQNYFVIESQGELIGCGGYNFSDDLATGIISWDILHPQQQGKGFGTVLLNYRIEKLKEDMKIKIVSVRTSQVVFKFYEKAGFILKDVVKDYWAEGFDLYRMELLIEKTQ